ncbi:protein TonB [Sphingobium sp. OAS761]|uniref:energy transducer TonB family protein n=1 Tax=Sphingobium sp. OAS761 TaxID=2817901 RepID=UPI0020A19B16|nr:energy transducer TonB [Sphingobium sp. OAS761]MCP1469619.1 protein TonB [Sphingobium sp. OAS761]
MTWRDQLTRDQMSDAQDFEAFGDSVVLKSYLYGDAGISSDLGESPSVPTVEWAPPTRYCDQPMDWRTRLVGLGGTTAMLSLVAAAGTLGWHVAENVNVSPSPPVVVNLRSFEAPPEPVREVPEGPEKFERQEAKPEPKPDVVIPTPLIRLSVPSAALQDMPEPTIEIVDPGPTVSETTAPKSIAAPQGRQVSNDAKATWEALVLAHLEKYRRYPARARAARQQGVTRIRFTMNRAGRILSAEIARKSGFFALDQAALGTLRRAEPLPAIPEGMPDEVELTVPVEFFIR